MSYNYSDEDDLAGQVARLAERVAELEARVAELEKRPGSRTAAIPAPTSDTAGDGAAGVSAEDLAEAVALALTQLGEGDAAAIRRKMVENGQPASLGRSDVNKVLYANKARFTVARQEGVKPIWKLA